MSSYSSREQGLELSCKLAREQLSKITDIQEQCRKSGARYITDGQIAVDYLNQPYCIALPDVEISLEDGEVEVPVKEKILILHYFIMAKGRPASGALITYKQLPGGISYFAAFSQRTITPLVNRFGKKPELLMRAAAKLGGREATYGDVSVTINAFAHVPITFVLWRGDEDLAPNGNILFDANVPDYLPTEDVAVVSETITWKLVKAIPFT
ncbi:MAG: DUF3786 domain-containing protein [Dehalococcoidia bacterium]